MVLPQQRPWLIVFRLTYGQVSQLVGRPPDAPELKPGRLKPWIPVGATAWRLPGETEWRDLTTLPRAWGLLPKLDMPITPMDAEEYNPLDPDDSYWDSI